MGLPGGPERGKACDDLSIRRVRRMDTIKQQDQEDEYKEAG